jgi:hypothetical protein
MVVNLDADLRNADWPKRTPDRMVDLVGHAPLKGLRKKAPRTSPVVADRADDAPADKA